MATCVLSDLWRSVVIVMEGIRCNALILFENQIDLVAASEELEDSLRVCEVEPWLSILRAKSLTLGVTPSFFATQVVLHALKKAGGTDDNKFLIARIQHLQQQRLFDGDYFAQTLLKDLHLVPVGILTCLLECNVIDITSLLMRPTVELVDYFRPILCCGNRSLLNGLTKWLIHESCIMKSDEAKELLLSLVNECYFSTEVWKEYDLLDAANNDTKLPLPLLCKLHCDVLMDILLNKEQLTVHEVCSCQEKWCYDCLPSNVITLHTKLVEAIDSDATVIKSIHQALMQKLLNWPALLKFISSYVNSGSRAAQSLKEFVVELARRAIEQRDIIFLQSSLLLARQAALHGSHIHPKYQTWFHSVFGQLTIASTRKAQEFILVSLSELVPYEPVYCLKAHIAQPLMQLAKKASEDYCTLVQTRLRDLLPPDSNHSFYQQPSQEVIDEVKEILAEYNKKGGIPERLQFMSCFKRPHFIGHFLPTLLSPSKFISQLEGRDALVTALKTKIPQKMYRDFKRSFPADGTKLSPVEDVSEEQLSLSCINELLQQLLLVKNEEASFKLVSKLSSILKNMLPSQLVRRTNDELFLTSPGLLPLHIKIVDIFLNTLCQLLSSSGCHGNKVKLCFEMFSGHFILHKVLLIRLLELLSKQITQLSHGQLIAVTKLISSMWLSHVDMQVLTMHENTSTVYSTHQHLNVVKSSKDYCECCCVHGLPMRTKAEQTATYSFCCYFMNDLLNQRCSTTNTDDKSPFVPSIVLTKFKYLLLRMPESVTSLHLLPEHKQMKTMTDTCQVDFSQWLMWELAIEPMEDILSQDQRESYLRNTVYECYLPLACQHQDRSVHSAVSQLFSVLVERDNTPSYQLILSLFQSVCMSVGSSTRQTDTTVIVETVLHYFSCRTDKNIPFQSILNVLSSVPPWLLFSDGPTAQLTYLSSLAEFLRQLMSFSDSYLLPPSLLYHICKGIRTFSNGSNLLEQLLHMSTLFKGSLVMGWLSISDIMTSYDVSYSSPHAWLHGDHSQVYPSQFNSVLLGVCCYHTLSEVTSNHQAIWQVIQNILDVKLKEEILVVVLDCCARQATEKSLTADSPNFSLAMNCVSIYPGALVACSFEFNSLKLHKNILTSLRFEFCRQKELPRLLPLFFMRLLMSLPSENKLKQVIEFRPSLLSLCMLAHHHFMESDLAQIMEPNFLQHCTQLTEQFIVETPLCEMQNLDAKELKCHSTLKPFLERKLHLCGSKDLI